MENDKTRIETLRIAMKNPSMTKMIIDGINSPLRSSQRERAKSVLSSVYNAQMNKAQKKMMPVVIMNTGGKRSGQGGPQDGSVVLMPSQPKPTSIKISLKPATLNPYSFKVNNETVEPLNLVPPQFNGQGGNLDSNTSYKPGFWNSVGRGVSNVAKFFGIGASDERGFTPGAGQGIPIRKTLTNLGFGQKNALGFPASYSTPTQGPTLPQSSTTLKTPEQPVVDTSLIDNNVLSRDKAEQQNGINIPTETVSTTTQESNIPYGPTLPTPVTKTPSVPIKTTITDDPLINYLMESYDQGIGSNAFALGVMADAKKLQSLFPGVPINQIPVGASLAGQLNDLEDSLIKEYKVNELHNSLNTAINTGQSLPDDVTAYIRGKDELLNNVDTMIKKSTDEYLNSPMDADPFYQKSMQQYINYLTILKGRTTQRYVDYLNTAINYQNNQVTQLQTAYNAAADKVNKLYTQKASITTEQYTQIKDTLTQMYDNVAKRASILDGTNKDMIDLQKASAELAATVLKNAALIKNSVDRQNYINQYGASAGLSGINASSITGKTASDLSATELKTVDERVALASDLNAALSDSILTSNGIPPGIITQKYAEAKAAKDIESISSDGKSLASSYSSAKTESEQLQSIIDEVKSKGGDTTELETLKNNYDTVRNNAFEKGITSLIENNLDVVRTILEEMKKKDSYEDWANATPGIFNFSTGNKDKTEYAKVIELAKYLFVIAKANSDADFKNTSANEIASAIYAQL